jgi:threonine dehydrogenase-like Zn-dependent dehydrogenase
LALLQRSRVHVVPEGVSAEEATFAVLAATVLNGVRRAKIEIGEAVALAGAGLIGQLTLQFVRLAGAFPIVSIDLSENRLKLASRLGATHTVCAPVDQARDEVLRLTRGRGADVAFEVTGHPAVVAPLLKLMRREGRVILLGSSRGASQVDFHDEVHTLGLHLIGAHVSTHPQHETFLAPWTRERHVELFLDLLQARHLDITSLITHRYSAAQAPEAFRMLAEDRTRALAVLLDWKR